MWYIRRRSSSSCPRTPRAACSPRALVQLVILNLDLNDVGVWKMTRTGQQTGERFAKKRKDEAKAA
jgi:cytochrome c-type biogenesis protein CcmH/NrfG